MIELDVHGDSRGSFTETYHQRRYAESGLGWVFVQDNFVHSHHHVLRGLHYQRRSGQGKLVYVTRGEIFDASVDIRQGSPTFGQWVGLRLSHENMRQVFVPPGFAHGYCVVSEDADVIYKCTDLYAPDDEHGIIWDDPDIGIEWPVQRPILSERDQRHPRLKQVPRGLLPTYREG
jgi:dTDP-4-dehydrorhamnose 3,5-epimerase